MPEKPGSTTKIVDALREKRNGRTIKILEITLAAVLGCVFALVTSYLAWVGDVVTKEDLKEALQDKAPWVKERGEVLSRISHVEQHVAELKTQISTQSQEIRADLKAIREGLMQLNISVGILQKKIDNND